MKRCLAFLRGVMEYRSIFSMYYTSPDLIRAYDKGRAFMRKVTCHG